MNRILQVEFFSNILVLKEDKNKLQNIVNRVFSNVTIYAEVYCWTKSGKNKEHLRLWYFAC